MGVEWEKIQVKFTFKVKFLSEMNQVTLAAKVKSEQWVAAILIIPDEGVSNGQQDLWQFSRIWMKAWVMVNRTSGNSRASG